MIAYLKPLPKVKGKLLSSFEQSFIIKAAKLWNFLPPKLTEISDFSCFKAKLVKYLEFIPDEPPVLGYHHNNRNSIREYKPVLYETVFGS